MTTRTGAFVTMQRHYERRDLGAREWRKKAGKVVGYFCNNVPDEMILAADFFSFRISGDQWGSTELADRYTEASYQPDVRCTFYNALQQKI